MSLVAKRARYDATRNSTDRRRAQKQRSYRRIGYVTQTTRPSRLTKGT